MTDYTALREAAALLDEHAASVRMTHTIGPAYNDWTGESEAKADHDRHTTLATSLRAMDAELDALREDAERYRWLRSRLPGAAYRIAGVIYSEGGEGVDAAIDAKRKETP